MWADRGDPQLSIHLIIEWYHLPHTHSRWSQDPWHFCLSCAGLARRSLCECVCVRVVLGSWCDAESHQALNTAADGDKLSCWESSRSISNYPTGSGIYSCLSLFLSANLSLFVWQLFSQSPSLHALLSFHLSPLLFLLFIHPSSSLTFSFSFNRHHLAVRVSLHLSV